MSKPQPPTQAPVTPTTGGTPTTFWAKIRVIRDAVYNESFGKNVEYRGSGGDNKFKDTKALTARARELFKEHDIIYIAEAVDVETKPIITSNAQGQRIQYLTTGNYKFEFFIGEESVYESLSYGSFDGTSSAQATHGALTVAKSSLLFNILDASLFSEEELETQRESDNNRQDNRNPAQPKSTNPYANV